ncbi:hypothetical protein AB4090_05130 [Acidithiobacillus sp. IBUN Pt1247-S3]
MIDFLEEVSRTFSDMTKTGYTKYLTDLETADDDTTFALNDSSLSTLIEVSGLMTLAGREEFQNISRILTESLSLLMKTQGITVAFYFQYDPQDKSLVHKNFEGMRNTAKSLQFDMDDVFSDWERAMSRYVHGESVYIALTTRLSKLVGYQKKKAKAAIQEQQRKTLPLRESVWASQSMDKGAVELRNSHAAMVASFVQNLGRARISARPCEVHDAIRIMRGALFPVGEQYRALLPGDRLSVRFKDKLGTMYGPKDTLEIHYPSLHSQIFRQSMELEGGAIRIGDRWFQGITMSVPPENLSSMTFNTLLQRINGAPDPFPWRMAIHLDSGGLDLLGMRDTLATLFAGTSSVNRRYNRAVKELRSLYEVEGTAIVRFRCTFSVEASSREELADRSSRMIAAINDWGNADAAKPLGMGQPLALCATIPGLLSKSPAPSAAAPLSDIPRFVPLLRPGQNWEDGMPLRSPDGCFLPYREGSSKQASFIEVGIGPLGSGKSATLNVINLSFLMAAGLPRMPYLSVVDIGPSSKGVVSLIQSGLPEDQQHLAVYKRIQMTREYAANPFDTWTGFRYPTSSQKSFLVGLVTLIGTPVGYDQAPKHLPDLANLLVEKAYSRYADDKDNAQPKLYRPMVEADNYDVEVLDKAIQEEGIPVDSKTTWWELVDAFFLKGMRHEAEIANRYAVPTLKDIAALTSEQDVVAFFGEELTRALRTSLMGAISQYVILSEPTRFTLQGAKVVALDLDEVAKKGSAVSDRQTAVVYMLARHIVLSRFFFEEGDIRGAPKDRAYQEYYQKFYEDLRIDPKRICFDELHRITKNSTVAGQIVSDVETVIRESRKWNIHIGLYSQSHEDIPKIMRDLATTVFIFGANDAKVASESAECFSMGDTAAERMPGDLRKPSREGATMMVKFVLDDGVSIQSLMNTVGPITLWAISSTSEDSSLRSRLYRDLGQRPARAILAKMYPGGTVKDTKESLQRSLADPRHIWGERWDEHYRKARAIAGGDAVDVMEMIYLDVMKRARAEGLV